MKVKLIEHTHLSTCVRAIRTCWDSHDRGGCYSEPTDDIIDLDKKLLKRVILKHKHGSTAEHLVYCFEIERISRAVLQELARHRHASLSVRSSRYTLKELKEEKPFSGSGSTRAKKYIQLTGEPAVDIVSIMELEQLRQLLHRGISNDLAKFALPECYLTDLVLTINMRSLQNFIKLRTDKSALWAIRELAYAMYEVVPNEHKFLLEDYVYKGDEQ